MHFKYIYIFYIVSLRNNVYIFGGRHKIPNLRPPLTVCWSVAPGDASLCILIQPTPIILLL